jgi:hypothetical protein
MDAWLVLEDGRTFPGKHFGAPAEAAGEVCFNTSMCGYQEVLTDPSFVKAAVFSFDRFPGHDTLLGPEMRSTGEVMGTADSFGMAFAKAMAGAGQALPLGGTAFLSVNDSDKPGLLPVARGLAELGFHLLASEGTAAWLAGRGGGAGGYPRPAPGSADRAAAAGEMTAGCCPPAHAWSGLLRRHGKTPTR